MPGFIDAHKHINTGPNEKELMQSLLEAGYTTVLLAEAGRRVITLRDHIESGMISGPRIIPSERVNLRGTPDEARAAVRAMAANGIKHTGEIALTPEPGPPSQEIEVLKAVVDEAAKIGVQVNVHAVSTSAMVAAIDAGVRRLVHLPNNRHGHRGGLHHRERPDHLGCEWRKSNRLLHGSELRRRRSSRARN